MKIFFKKNLSKHLCHCRAARRAGAAARRAEGAALFSRRLLFVLSLCEFFSRTVKGLVRELSGDGVGRSCSSSGLRRRGGGFVASQVGLLFSLSFSFLLSFLFCSLFSFLIVLFQSLLEEEVRAPPGEEEQAHQLADGRVLQNLVLF